MILPRRWLVGAGLLIVGVTIFLVYRAVSPKREVAVPPPVDGGEQAATCPLTGLEPTDPSQLKRPAVGVKIENDPSAYPLWGLEEADLVFEQPIEAGHTRFLAIYHCRDADAVGPIRSARLIDPLLLKPLTSVLAHSGANRRVANALDHARVVQVTELTAPRAFDRIIRPDLGAEHTLYANTMRVRRAARQRFTKAPPRSLVFGRLQQSVYAPKVTIRYDSSTTIVYRHRGASWVRSQEGQPFVAPSGQPMLIDNILVLEHDLRYLSRVVDVAGNPSVAISDPTGGGRAFLFRGGRLVTGRWQRRAVADPISLLAADGSAMRLRPGTTWIQIVPSATSEVRGGVSFRGRMQN